MRRSSAPSKRGIFKSSLVTENTQSSPSPVSASEKHYVSSQFTPVGRSVNSILGLIKNEPTKSINVASCSSDNSNINADKKENADSTNVSHGKSSSTRIFSVVFGKQSKKKHKTWEGDGTLEVNFKSAVLKDEDGKIIGQATTLKVDLIEGAQLFVGSKEVEILNDISNQDENIKKRTLDDHLITSTTSITPVTHLNKKRKSLTNSHYSPLHLRNSFKLTSSPSNFKPLTMPKPNSEHQWQFNEDHLPITDVNVDAILCKVLRPHQREGVIFLYRCVLGMRSTNGTGAILADEMGLGKTIQCITLIWTLLHQGPYGGQPVLNKVLIVVPSSLVQNWDNEFKRWLGSYRIKVYSVNKKNKAKDYTKFPLFPVMIISYEMFVRSFEDIKNIIFDLIICDEGHRLKNSGIRTSSLLSELPCQRRIILTGTPVQNDLQEFYSLVDFVNPGILGSPSDFRKNYELPILASREPNASEDVVSEGESKAEELNRITNSFILRRTQSVIGNFLPKKSEYVIFCEPSSIQNQLYSIITNFWNERDNEMKGQESVPHLSVIITLKKVCNHPVLVESKENEDVDEESVKNIISDNLDNYKFHLEDSGKLTVTWSILNNLKNTNERIVLVSNFTQTLDLFENLCKEWSFKYLRFDGSTPTSQRSEIVDRFNDESSDVFVLLLSSKAGGVGLNLIGGSRLILFDSDWNPATDLQAMARIWREGQKKNVHIYRLLTSGTIEEKIFQRQLTKTGLSESIVDVTNTSSVKLSKEELKDLFAFSANEKCTTHQILNCACPGDGSVPEPEHLDEGFRVEQQSDESDLLIEDPQVPSSLRMNQLFQWEHHENPIGLEVCEEMRINGSENLVNYVFRNNLQNNS